MNETIESTILRQLVTNEAYMRAVLPFLKVEYFQDTVEKIVYEKITQFIQKYNGLPSQDALVIALQDDKSVTEETYKYAVNLVHQFEPDASVNQQWLMDSTEKFCKDKAVYNAILKSISIIDGRDKEHSTDALPSILSTALAVNFDNSVGHDYIDDAIDRFEFYHRKEDKIPFDLDLMNKITGGGLPNKSLNIILASTGGGKSLFMCHHAATCLTQGKNVLYISLEMAEERIAERIDANLMNIEVDELKQLPKQMFESRIKKIESKTQGKLIIKEYPTASAHVGHFKALLNELTLKRSFSPDIIFIDYLNICASSRYKPGAGVNSYTLVKGIAEELRGLAVEFNVPVVSATQTTRSGFGNTDIELTDTSESIALPATADLMFALIASEELDQLNQIMVKQLKNRYNDPTNYKRFVIGINRAKMKLYDVETEAQKNLTDTGIAKNTGDTNEHQNIGNRLARNVRDYSSLKF